MYVFVYPGRVFSPVLFLLAEVPNKTKHVPIVDEIVEKLLIKKRTFFSLFCILYVRGRGIFFQMKCRTGNALCPPSKNPFSHPGDRVRIGCPDAQRVNKRELQKNHFSKIICHIILERKKSPEDKSPICQPSL